MGGGSSVPQASAAPPDLSSKKPPAPAPEGGAVKPKGTRTLRTTFHRFPGPGYALGNGIGVIVGGDEMRGEVPSTGEEGDNSKTNDAAKMAEEKLMLKNIGWFVEDVTRPGQYEAYNQESSDRLESAFMSKKSTCVVVFKKHTFTVNLETMQQIPPGATGGAAAAAAAKLRSVRRAPFEEVKDPSSGEMKRIIARQGIVDPFDDAAEEQLAKVAQAQAEARASTDGIPSDLRSAAMSTKGEVYRSIENKTFQQIYPSLRQTIFPHTTPIYTMSLATVPGTGSTVVLTAGKDRSLLEWDLQTHNTVTDYPVGNAARSPLSILSVAYSPSANFVIAGMDDKVARVYKRGVPKVELSLVAHTHKVYGVDFVSTEQQCVTAAMDGKVCLWDMSSGQMIVNQTCHSSHIFAIKMSTVLDYFGISVGDDKLVCLHDFRQPNSVTARIAGHTKTIWNVDINEASGAPTQFVTCGMDNTVRMWDARNSEKELAIITEHKKSVHAAFYTPNGKGILSCSKDQQVLLSNAENGSSVFKLHAHGASIFRAKFNASTASLITCAGDATVNVWDWTGGLAW